jgi:hypothetical protein
MQRIQNLTNSSLRIKCLDKILNPKEVIQITIDELPKELKLLSSRLIIRIEGSKEEKGIEKDESFFKKDKKSKDKKEE